MSNNDSTREDAFVAAVRELAAANPDFVYQPKRRYSDTLGSSTCNYLTEDGKGDCLIGQALLKSGLMTVDELRRSEGKGASVVARQAGLDRSVGTWAEDIQFAQDEGRPWGVAVADAGEVRNA